ncbi:MAG: hypothetical protein KF723_00905 [Rhizobiaceae bacterium]|nr:hypothetical protein [Rhizobiaceae bacterium]
MIAARRAAAGRLAFGAVLATVALSMPAWALSEIKPEEMPAETVEPAPDPGGVPAPEPIQKSPLPAPTMSPPAPDGPVDTNETPEAPGAVDTDETPADPGTVDTDEEDPGTDDTVETPERPDPDGPIPDVVYDLQTLPAPVRKMRELLIEAAKTGDIEALRPLIGVGPDITQLSLGGIEGDPVDFLREVSGDDQGQEILAILEEVLSAGFVHLGVGTDEDLYVWPYFFAVPLDALTPPQRVELFKIVTAGDYEDMKTYGAYIFYRVGITPEGRWAFFVAGD